MARDDTDRDDDGVPDASDNCTDVASKDRLDSDGDGYANACDSDSDLNNGSRVIALDSAHLQSPVRLERGDSLWDLNGDGIFNAHDLALFKKLFIGRPRPSAWHMTIGQ